MRGGSQRRYARLSCRRTVPTPLGESIRQRKAYVLDVLETQICSTVLPVYPWRRRVDPQ